ncbi:MAG: hypothetical protein KF760_22200 [Candidatus Eremiobacteraeota bacterium]|nr:hypothetical protein [Candidatus Eremiobacteraeota bacterium]MCW5866462.1 hypothetical protein [Candidatus Eremiobacteraeota bacterium]
MNFDDRLVRVKWVFLLLLLVVPLRLVALQLGWRQQLNTDPHNSRLLEKVAFRGRVLDRHGQLLAYSRGNHRIYPQGSLPSHWTGFYSVDRGVGGAERWKNELLRERREENGVTSRPGHELRLSLDLPRQRSLERVFPAEQGAALLVDLDRGQVLAAISKPDFQPARVGADWRTWQHDERAPLLNRPFLGLYPAGPLARAWSWKQLPRRPVSLMDWTSPQPVKGQLLISPGQVAYYLLKSGSELPLSQLFSEHVQPWRRPPELAPLQKCAQGWQWSCVARLEQQVVTWAVALKPPYLVVLVWENSDQEKAALRAAWKSI